MGLRPPRLLPILGLQASSLNKKTTTPPFLSSLHRREKLMHRLCGPFKGHYNSLGIGGTRKRATLEVTGAKRNGSRYPFLRGKCCHTCLDRPSQNTNLKPYCAKPMPHSLRQPTIQRQAPGLGRAIERKFAGPGSGRLGSSRDKWLWISIHHTWELWGPCRVCRTWQEWLGFLIRVLYIWQRSHSHLWNIQS